MTDPADSSMSLVQHLIELRDRLLRILICVLVIFCSIVYFSQDIYTFVATPLQKFLPAESSMIATEVASPFLTPFKLTFFVAVLLAIPYILFQFWAYISPALYMREKRIAIPILLSSVVLFYAGIAFSYYIVFPIIFGFFTSVSPEGVTVMTDISAYLNFVLKLFFAFGTAFEIPIVAIVLIVSGAVDADSLANKRPYIIVGCFILGMLLTPPDILSQSLLAVPMWMLFEVGVFAGRHLKKVSSEETA